MHASFCPSLDPNIAFLLWNTASHRPAHPALIERGTAISYAELRDRAAAIAETLREAALEPNDRVVIFLERGEAAAAAFFGVVAMGGIAINANETLRPRQLEHILRHSGAKVLITSGEMLLRQPRPLETDVLVLDTATTPMAGSLTPRACIGRDVAQIIYTSGSTGLPKGVTLTHANLWAGMRAVTQYVRVTQNDRIASLLPFSFDYGFNQLLCAVGTGATLVIERSPLPQQIIATLRAHEVTVLPALPPLWLQLLSVPSFENAPIPSLRAMTNTGGRVPADAVRRLRLANPQAELFLMYGLTEAFRATYLDPREVDAHPDSIGRAIPGAEILVLRDDGTECAVGEVGELVQRGPTVALGYWNDPETTAQVYRPNPSSPLGTPDQERVVYSGDLVRRDSGGRLYYVGRRDRMIKTLGYRVSPDEIADVLYASRQIAEGVVATESDGQRGERIVAHVVLTGSGDMGVLEAFCRAELPRYMQPYRFEAHDVLPRTSSGKFDVDAAAGRRLAS